MNTDNIVGNENNIDLTNLEECNNKNIYNEPIYKDETHTDLVVNSNFLNLFSSIYVAKEKGILFSLPHMAVFITSYLFWRNPRYNYTRYIDYIVAQTSIGFTLIYSFILNKEFVGIFLFLSLYYVFMMSCHYKTINEENRSLRLHSLLYFIGSVGNVYIFTK